MFSYVLCKQVACDHKDYNLHLKIQPFVDHLLDVFKRYYYPRKDISIDESLIAFQGRTKALHYLPNKRHARWGVKLWCLSEASTGYLYRFILLGGRLAVDRDENKPSMAIRRLL